MNIVFMAICFYFVMGIMGVSLMMGTFWRCNDDTVTGFNTCIGSYTNDLGIPIPRMWFNPDMNFDNTANAMMTLFKMATLNNWAVVMHDGMSASEIDTQPSRFTSPANAIFFLFHIVIGSLFVLQLIISVIIDNFSKEMHGDRT